MDVLMSQCTGIHESEDAANALPWQKLAKQETPKTKSSRLTPDP